MTRFARAKGSKSSNERVPEAATPWDVMKQDLQKSQEEGKNKKEREQFQAERQRNYDNFVKEKESKIEKKWAEFPKSIKKKKNKNLLKDVTEDMIEEMCAPHPEVDQQFQDMTKKIEEVLAKEGVKKKKNNEDTPEEATAKVSPKKLVIKKAKNKKQTLKIAPIAMETETPEKTTVKVKEEAKNTQQASKIAPNKMNQKNNKKKPNILQDSVVINGEKQDVVRFNNNTVLKSDQDRLIKLQQSLINKGIPPAQVEKKMKFEAKKAGKKLGRANRMIQKNDNTKPNITQKTKLGKVRDNLEHKRRKPFTDNSIVINGEKHEIVHNFGFPLLKSDNDELINLQKSLISKGIPKAEVEKTIKLQRRRAEKKLARAKKVVCYQCREVGHMLSECPQVGDGNTLVDTSATGICFKCGSTEHSSKGCKINTDYKYAKCFICREQGHISNQCPDNPRGLYPKGGACNLCGDVTHLKKDCPKHVEEQKTQSVFLNTISDGNIEGIDDGFKSEKKTTPNKKNIIKF